MSARQGRVVKLSNRLRGDIKFQDIRSGDVVRVRWHDDYRDCSVTSADRVGTHVYLKTRSIRLRTPNGGHLVLSKSQADSIMGIFRHEGR